MAISLPGLLAACGGKTGGGAPGATTDSSDDASTGSHAGGSTGSDAQPSDCVEATAGASCTPGESSACNQPGNPCAAGYIWACDNNNGTWIEETIVCYTDSSFTAQTTAACAPNEVLFVDDVAGDPCEIPGDGGACAEGTYHFEPDCCVSPTDAYCVPDPCGGALECGCAGAVCQSQCGSSEGDPGVMCSGASSGVIDCLCGKA
jgi:hypothetical protein